MNPALLEQNEQRIAALIEFRQHNKPESLFQSLAGTAFRREAGVLTCPFMAAANGQYEFDGRINFSFSMALEITRTGLA